MPTNSRAEETLSNAGAALGRTVDSIVDGLKAAASHKMVVKDGDRIVAEVSIPLAPIIQVVEGAGVKIKNAAETLRNFNIEFVPVTKGHNTTEEKTT